MKSSTCKLTILVVFFNGKREAERTLHSLTTDYQIDSVKGSYKVLVLDSGSSEPLDQARVESFGDYFEYHYVKTSHPSPTEALAYGLSITDTPYISVCIDGARMLSPGILKHFFQILEVDSNPHVFTPRYYIGEYDQMDSVHLGYNKEEEDKLFKSIPWRENGYRLFDICSIEQSEEYEYGSPAESNLFFVKTDELIKSKIFEKPYYSAGGGLINLDCFLYFSNRPKIKNYCLVGEGTFHQIHGGVASNTAREDNKVPEYRIEYYKINNTSYHRTRFDIIYYGKYNEHSIKYIPTDKLDIIQSFVDKVELTKEEIKLLNDFIEVEYGN